MTKPDTWMPLVIGDYLKDTSRLTAEQHGAYLLLIMDYWVNGPPQDDDEELAAIAKLDPKAWRRQRPKIERFFRIEGGVWRHKRIDAELSDAQAKSHKAAEKAATAATARWEKERSKRAAADARGNAPSIAKGNAPAVLEECPSSTQSVEERDADASPVGSAAPPPTGEGPKKDPWTKDQAFGEFWDAATAKMRARAKSKAKVWPAWKAARNGYPQLTSSGP